MIQRIDLIYLKEQPKNTVFLDVGAIFSLQNVQTTLDFTHHVFQYLSCTDTKFSHTTSFCVEYLVCYMAPKEEIQFDWF
jgi:excinuclease UvrABC nuclease subunit